MASSQRFFSLRRMEERDLLEVMAIEKLSFPNPWHESTFLGEIQQRPISFPYVIVHSLEKRVIGYIIFWQINEDVQINNIALHPDFRHLGIGKAVMQDVIDEVKERRARFISLEVRPSNTIALRLYQKLGFQVLGIRKNYYSSPPEDAIVMGLSLT